MEQAHDHGENDLTDFEHSRRQATLLVARGAIACAPVVAVIGWVVGTNATMATIGAALFAVLGVASMRLADRPGRILAAQALTGQCIVLNAAMMLHPFQIDTHMMYFAVLAVLVMMSGLQALILAAATIAAHHMVLTFVMPSLVYPSSDLTQNLERTAIHAVIVALETAALAFTIHTRLKLDQAAREQAAERAAAAARVDDALAQAQLEKTRAENALAEAEIAMRAAAKARDEAETARKRAEDGAQALRAAEALTETQRERHDKEAMYAVGLLITKLEQLSQGDMTVRFNEALPDAYSRGADAFNAAMIRIEGTMRDVMLQTRAIQSESGEITHAAAELSDRTERQAATLSGLAKSLGSLTGIVRDVATDANQARAQTLAARDKAHQGGEVMAKAVEAMDAIENSSSEVRKIISVIEDIAFQTNLLALNAGVEAARAGEAGRGFAVVATEVRALASRSSDAAREIDGLINASGHQISDGVQLVKRTGVALGEIKSAVEDTAKGMQTIADATERQSGELAEVTNGLNQLDQVTQQNAAMFEETMASNTKLTENARHLTGLIDQFNVTTTNATKGKAPASDWQNGDGAISPVPKRRSA